MTGESAVQDRPQLVVVGSGIAGLAAAAEAAQHGADVTVVDLWSVFGGHSISAGGGLLLVDTPNQRRLGIDDSADLVIRDAIAWGGDPDPDWLRYFVDNNRTAIHDWLAALGIRFRDPFVDLARLPGNSRPRFHPADGGGFALVRALYLSALGSGRVHFRFNTEVVDLMMEGPRVRGIRTRNTRTAVVRDMRADAVVLATGGFQGNLDRVEAHWVDEVAYPDTMLSGAGLNARGSGLELATGAGGSVDDLGRMWNYASGVVDPRNAGESRGLRFINPRAIWLNESAERFVNEDSSEPERLDAVLRQRGQFYWVVFDAAGLDTLLLQVPGWQSQWFRERFYDSGRFLHTADSLPGLARKIGLDAEALQRSVDRYNRMLESGTDRDFGRFTSRVDSADAGHQAPAPIDSPPYHALRGHPLARKSMGGVRTDRHTRVLSADGEIVPGLYAAGEVTGFGGINGKASLEGTFLGPSLLMGRVAGAKSVSDFRAGRPTTGSEPDLQPAVAGAMPRRRAEGHGGEARCRGCHDLASLAGAGGRGYAHVRAVHAVVLSQEKPCGDCHAEMSADGSAPHRIDPWQQLYACETCHLGRQARPVQHD